MRPHPKTLRSRRSQRRVAEFYPYASKREMDVLKRECDRIVRSSIANGSLVRQPCEKCGNEKSEAHHEDYSKPLAIEWLCRHHHRLRDADLRDAWRGRVRALRTDALPVAVLKRLARLELLQKQPVENPGRFVPVKRAYRSTLLSLDCSIDLVRQTTIAIAAAMDAEQMSERALSQRLGVSRQLVNNSFAAGFRTLKVVAAIADALGYDASFVLRKREAVEAVAS